jgi:hypothetical protein
MHVVDSVQSRGLLLVVPSVDEIGHDVGYCSRLDPALGSLLPTAACAISGTQGRDARPAGGSDLPRIPPVRAYGQGQSVHPPAPPCCGRHGGDQLATLKRAQRDVQRPRSELELGRELRGRDGARMASRDHIEHRLLARGGG